MHEEKNYPLDETKNNFIQTYITEEVAAHRYSSSFGSNLLPGVYSSPLGVIPKPHSEKLQLINDHSAGPFSLNSMIPQEEGYIILDGMHPFGQYILELHCKHPEEELICFKSDVSHAFRNLPCSPEWQAKQVVTFEGNQYVDRTVCFGSRAVLRLWCTFSSLVLWIALKVQGIEGLFS
jgi:hypothetical protein